MNIGTYQEDRKERVIYVANDITFLIHYLNDSIYNIIHPIFAHLSSDILTKNKIAIDLVQKNAEWVILFNQIQIDVTTKLSRLALLLQKNILVALYQVKPYLITMHAASLEYNDNVFIFPAISGSGKTTLTAALMDDNFVVYSDELSIIKNDGQAISLPFSLNVKEGSWHLLEKKYPILKETNYHIRFDDQKVKFLKPLQQVSKLKRPTYVIFPKYKKNVIAKIKVLNACQAMHRIKEAGYELDEPLSEHTFEKILDYILSLPKYDLEYSSLDDAIRIIKRLAVEKS